MRNSIIDNVQEIHIQNMVVTSTIAEKLDLDLIYKKVPGSEYDTDKFPGLIYRQKIPRTAILLFSSGKLVCTGAKTMKEVQIAISNVIKILSKLELSLNNEPKISIQNIVATADLHTEFKLNLMAISLGLEKIEYEPEQFPGLVYRVFDPKVVFLIFSSGKIVCTGAKLVEDINKALEILKNELLIGGFIS